MADAPEAPRPRPLADLAANVPIALMLCATLGLAPFLPEPHLVGKIRWVAGGAVGMGPADWFDLVMHGSPFVWLVVAVGLQVRQRLT